MAGNGHDGPGSIFEENVVCDPDRNGLTRGRVQTTRPGEDPGLGLVVLLPSHQVHLGCRSLVGLHLFFFVRGGDLANQGVLRRQDHIGGPEHRVRPGGEDGNGGAVCSRQNREGQRGSLTPADPVFLRLQGGFRPIDGLQIVQEPLGVIGDPEEPLGYVSLFHGGVAPLAKPTDHLFIGQNRHAGGAPVDWCLLPFSQSSLEELEEDPLGPTVVFRVRGVDRVLPVEHSADLPKLPREIGHILGRQIHWIDALLQSKIFGVNPKGVEPDGLKDRFSRQSLVASVDIGAGEGVDIPNVEPLSGGVGEHHEIIIGFLRIHERLRREAVRSLFVPGFLPLFFYGPWGVPVRLVRFHHVPCLVFRRRAVPRRPHTSRMVDRQLSRGWGPVQRRGKESPISHS